MNKALAETYSYLNGFIALVIIVGCGYAGSVLGPYLHQLYAQANGLMYTGNQAQAEMNGLCIGVVIGLVVAIAICGLTALFIQMHSELKAIRSLLRK